MLNIVCLKWGDKYAPEYVNNLYAGIKRNTTINFKFHCFTEDPNGLNKDIIIQPLKHKYVHGWWNKLSLFSRDINIPKGDRVFFFDLDVLITSNIDDILEYKSNKFLILKDWYKGGNNVNSTCMSWIVGEHNYIWDSFVFDKQDAMDKVVKAGLVGDQGWTQLQTKDREYFQNIFPNRFVSFKQSCISGFSEETSVVCYHGSPSIPQSIHEINTFLGHTIQPQRWVLKYWRV